MTTAKSNRPAPRSPKGFRDSFAAEVIARLRMVEASREVDERCGFEPLESAAFELVDVLDYQRMAQKLRPAGIAGLRHRWRRRVPAWRGPAQRPPAWRQARPGDFRPRRMAQGTARPGLGSPIVPRRPTSAARPL